MRLRAMGSADVGIPEVIAAGGRIDPDLLYRALPYLVDPEWTRGHEFTVRYEVIGDGGGVWDVEVRDGERLRVTAAPDGEVKPTATVTVGIDNYVRMAGGTLTPSEAMQHQLTNVDGELYPVTLLGRWIDRARGRDDDELGREERQRGVQTAREGLLEPLGRG